MAFKKVTDIATLQKIANIIRRDIIEMIGTSQRGHYGGSLSSADLVAALYFYKMNHDPENPSWECRDRFILSKGHAAPVQYAALAECGYFSKDEFVDFKNLGSILQGHPDMTCTPGVEANTGSLGQGLSISIGIALGLRKEYPDCKVYTIIGDGELGEGQIWEAATVASHYKLSNLIAIVDKNNVQAMGFTRDRIYQGDLCSKWNSFGWYVIEINGHDIESIIKALDKACTIEDKPCVIIAETIKGKGISFAENTSDYHHNQMSQELYDRALFEIDQLINA
jgi:transketolase